MTEAFELMPSDGQAKTADSHAGRRLACDPTPRRVTLRTVRQVADEMSRVYRAMRSGELAPGDGTKLAYVLGQIGKMLEVVELEDLTVKQFNQAERKAAVLDGIDLGKLTDDELDDLQKAVSQIEALRVG
jgi:hypothetical protein